MLARLEFLPADAGGLSPLARAARAGKLDLPGLAVPRSAAELAPPAELARDGTAHLARWLESRLTALAPHVRALEAVRDLAAPDAACVVAAVRPGLLLSPLAGLWDALAAVRLAEELRERWRRPVCALAWIRADEGLPGDARSFLPNRHHELQGVGLAGSARGEEPPSDLPLEDERHRLPAIRAFLGQLYGDHPHLQATLETLLPRAGESLGDAAARALLELLGHRGLVVVQPEWLRDESAQALAALVAADPRAGLEAGARALVARGLAETPAQAPALVLRRDEAARRPLRAGGEGFRYDDEPGSRTPAELAAEIVQAPARFAAAAALAPLVVERVLPVAAWVGGEGELARLAGLAPLRGAAAAPFVLRAPLTMVDGETERALERTGLDLRRALRGEPPPASEADAEGREAALSELDRAIEEAAARLLESRARLGEIEPSLPRQLERAVARARAELERVRKKAERVAGDRSGRGRRHARRLETVLRPQAGPQEATLAPFHFLARHGRGWLDELAAEWDPFGAEHLAVHLADTA